MLIECVGRLHNFCINERLLENGEEEVMKEVDAETAGRLFLPSMPDDENGDPIDLEATFGATKRSGHSDCREWMVDRIEKRQLKRPAANRIKETIV